MKLNNLQFRFVICIGILIVYVYFKGYRLSFGDARAKDGHKINSLHYVGLAIDLNLFKDGEYLKKTSDHKFLGEFWESLHSRNRWGGRYSDGNHYEHVPYNWR